MKKRKYTLRRRAERQARTRERIVDAAMELHETLGPAATTISALADRAGVQRLTVYRHFPKDEDLFRACSKKWLDLHPPPDSSKISDGTPAARTRSTLSALYRYYEETERMWTAVYRDLDEVPALASPVAEFEGFLSRVSTDLRACWTPRGSRQLRATLDHAVQFSTWKSLARRGLRPRAMAGLVSRWVSAAAGRPATANG